MSAWLSISSGVNVVQFRAVVWFFPVATALHFLEEGPRFTAWAQKYTSPQFTQDHWNRIHTIGFGYAAAFSTFIALYPHRPLVFLFFALCFLESGLNALFHLGATLYFRAYSPGLLTAIALYPPLLWLASRNALREGLLSTPSLAIALVMAIIIHSVDVAKNVFFRFPKMHAF